MHPQMCSCWRSAHAYYFISLEEILKTRLIGVLALFAGALSFTLPAAHAHVLPLSTARHASSFPVTITDDTGYKTTIPKLPRRIITLDPRDTETMFALNLSKRVVADGGKDVEGAACCTKDFKYPSQWPSPWGADYPVVSKTKTHIEGGYDPSHPFDVELVLKKDPDLVHLFELRQRRHRADARPGFEGGGARSPHL